MKKTTLTILVAVLFISSAALPAVQPKSAKVKPPVAGSGTVGAKARSAARLGLPHYRFENFTVANGLPDNHVYSVLVDGDRVWAGTDNGLGLFE